MITGQCPGCGKPLEIPGELTEFSCMYCGVRLRPEDLSGDGKEALLRELSESIGVCVTDHRNTLSQLMPKTYTPCYEGYAKAHREVLEAIDTLPSSHQVALATALLDAIDSWASQSKRPDTLLEDAKYTLCLLFVPAVRQLAPWQGLRFCEAVRNLWLERHPKHIFQLTTYEDIAGGFDRKKLCFITTAVCSYQGKSDDCNELTAFRNFRDGWLQTQPNGKALVERYYAIAPTIVTAINVTDPDRVYPTIWKTWLQPCYEALLRGDLAGCKRLYTDMVAHLAKTYLQ